MEPIRCITAHRIKRPVLSERGVDRAAAIRGIGVARSQPLPRDKQPFGQLPERLRNEGFKPEAKMLGEPRRRTASSYRYQYRPPFKYAW